MYIRGIDLFGEVKKMLGDDANISDSDLRVIKLAPNTLRNCVKSKSQTSHSTETFWVDIRDDEKNILLQGQITDPNLKRLNFKCAYNETIKTSRREICIVGKVNVRNIDKLEHFNKRWWI